MSLVRILVDGYSLLHSWPELHGKARYSAAARDELVRVLTLYRDATHTPITIFFDGSSPKIDGVAQTRSTPEVEILFSRAGQTADQMIERAEVHFNLTAKCWPSLTIPPSAIPSSIWADWPPVVGISSKRYRIHWENWTMRLNIITGVNKTGSNANLRQPK